MKFHKLTAVKITPPPTLSNSISVSVLFSFKNSRLPHIAGEAINQFLMPRETLKSGRKRGGYLPFVFGGSAECFIRPVRYLTCKCYLVLSEYFDGIIKNPPLTPAIS